MIRFVSVRRQARLWPALVLFGGLAAGILGALAMPRAEGGIVARPAGTAAGRLDAEQLRLERQIGAGKADARTWFEYGECLRRLGQYGQAAEAYEQASRLDPINRDIHFVRGLSLALADDRERLFQYLSDLALTDCRVVFEILERNELRPVLGEPRFRRLHEDARGQVVD